MLTPGALGLRGPAQDAIRDLWPGRVGCRRPWHTGTRVGATPTLKATTGSDLSAGKLRKAKDGPLVSRNPRGEGVSQAGGAETATVPASSRLPPSRVPRGWASRAWGLAAPHWDVREGRSGWELLFFLKCILSFRNTRNCSGISLSSPLVWATPGSPPKGGSPSTFFLGSQMRAVWLTGEEGGTLTPTLSRQRS